MRVLALVAVAACKFEHGNLLETTPPSGDGGSADSGLPADARAVDAGKTVDAASSMALLDQDFEGSLIGPFTNVYEMPSDEVNYATIGHSGTKSAYCITAAPAEAQATLYRDFSNRSQLYASMWIRLDTGFPPNDYVMIMAFVDDPNGTTWNNLAQVSVFPDMRVSMYNNAASTETFSTATLTVNTWHHIEALVRISATNGRLMLAIDGAVQFDKTGLDTGFMQMDKILTGIAWQGSANDPTALYVDDVHLE
jgi:hypothetical protein